MEPNQEEYKKTEGVFGGIELGAAEVSALPAKRGFWSIFKEACLTKIDLTKPIVVELTPYQQKVEDEVNAFLHQEITLGKIHDFLFQEIKFGKAK